MVEYFSRGKNMKFPFLEKLFVPTIFLSIFLGSSCAKEVGKKELLLGSYPVIKTTQLEPTSKFYEKHFGFQRTFSSDWYISLKSGNFELGILAPNHESIPIALRGEASNKGIILNFETDEVDRIYAEMQKENRKIHLEIKNEDFGQRHFITEDPNGIPIDVIKNIPPSEEFQKSYSK